MTDRFKADSVRLTFDLSAMRAECATLLQDRIATDSNMILQVIDEEINNVDIEKLVREEVRRLIRQRITHLAEVYSKGTITRLDRVIENAARAAALRWLEDNKTV